MPARRGRAWLPGGARSSPARPLRPTPPRRLRAEGTWTSLAPTCLPPRCYSRHRTFTRAPRRRRPPRALMQGRANNRERTTASGTCKEWPMKWLERHRLRLASVGRPCSAARTRAACCLSRNCTGDRDDDGWGQAAHARALHQRMRCACGDSSGATARCPRSHQLDVCAGYAHSI